MTASRARSICSLILAVIFVVAAMGCDDGGDSGRKVEEFRVAEPLTDESHEAGDEDLESQRTITAVSEPYDDIVAMVDVDGEPLAQSREELHQQCVTALKEIAFCSNDRAFLDVVVASPGLQAEQQRERFLDRAQKWFEPGGARVDCGLLLESDRAQGDAARRFWQRTSSATEMLCPDFAVALIDADPFRWFDEFWLAEQTAGADGQR